MKLFSRSTTDQLATARQSLAGAETKIVELEAARSTKLLEAETIAEVQRFDAELTAQRHAASICRDRIAGLVERKRQEERERLEAVKAGRIADMIKRVARRDAAAQWLETALAEARSAYAELSAADETIAPSGSYLSITSLSPLARRDRRQSDPMPRLVIGPVRAIAEGAGAGLAAAVKEKGIALIETMEAETIEEPADEAQEDDDEERAA